MFELTVRDFTYAIDSQRIKLMSEGVAYFRHNSEEQRYYLANRRTNTVTLSPPMYEQVCKRGRFSDLERRKLILIFDGPNQMGQFIDELEEEGYGPV